MPHEATKEKPSLLLFGLDCKSPMEAALLPPEHPDPVNIEDYREQLIISLSSARKLAATSIQAAQAHYKKYYDKKSHPVKYRVGEWVLIHFSHEETGRLRKLSRPWHGPYRENNPDVTQGQQKQIEVGQANGYSINLDIKCELKLMRI